MRKIATFLYNDFSSNLTQIICFLFIGLLVGCSSSDDDSMDIDLLEGLVGQFKLDGNTSDSSGFDNDGEIIGSVVRMPDRKGTINSAMLFNENDGFIDIGDVEELKLTNEISISVWVKANEIQDDWSAIINKWKNIGQSGYYLGLIPNDLRVRWNVSGHVIDSDFTIPTDEWTHIVVTYDGKYLNIYKNSALRSSKSIEVEILDTDTPFRIGQQSDVGISSAGGFNGGIDDVYVYNRALTLKEIRELSNKN